MVKQCSPYGDEIRNFNPADEAVDFSSSQPLVASPHRDTVGGQWDATPKNPTQIRLNLEDLKCFEVVERQFQHWGVTLSNCVAIQPSNPAYPPHSGTTVLMGAPRNGLLEISFERPVKSVNCYVTSSQRTVLCAFDREDNQIARVEIPSPNLAGSNSMVPPNAQLSVRSPSEKQATPNIYRVSFFAFDGQLTVDDLSFSF